MAYTVEAAKRARLVDRVVVSTDDEAVRRMASDLGAEAPFLRPAELATAGTPLDRVLQHCLGWLEEHERYRADIVVRLEISHPFREEGLIDRVIQTLVAQQLDTVFTVYEEHHNFWKVNRFGELEPISDERQTRVGRPPLYKEMSGLVSATRVDVAKTGERLGKRVGVVALTSLYALVDTEDELGLELARRLL
jgi:N-acylneuraminate cytidylyltransferase